MSQETTNLLIAFSDRVIREENLEGWKMEWETIDSFGTCYTDIKIFTIPERFKNTMPWYGYEYIIHEIAHALTPESMYINGGHSKKFYIELSRLIQTYLADWEDLIDGTEDDIQRWETQAKEVLKYVFLNREPTVSCEQKQENKLLVDFGNFT